MLLDPKWNKAKINVDDIGICFLNAISFIEKYGWCQNNLQSLDGRVCISGAVQLSSPNMDPSIVSEAFEFMKNELDHGYNNTISEWNDHPERTKEQVIEKLKELAYATRS